jgi:hypothetical protein
MEFFVVPILQTAVQTARSPCPFQGAACFRALSRTVKFVPCKILLRRVVRTIHLLQSGSSVLLSCTALQTSISICARRNQTMNRENKRRQFETHYYKNHPCTHSFTCKKCGRSVVPAGAGTDHRNHCPNCLTSLHLDVEPGDRAADCGGLMEPIAVWIRGRGEWAVIHRCARCGELSSNRVAADDNPMKLMSIALRPLSLPPFPLERIEEMTRLMAGDGALNP